MRNKQIFNQEWVNSIHETPVEGIWRYLKDNL